MKKIKIKRILLLFSLAIAMIGCFLVKSSNVKASDDLIFNIDIVGNSTKSNIIYSTYCEKIDKVVCVTNQSTICFMDYKNFVYSEETTISDIPSSVDNYHCTVVDKYLIVYKKNSSSKASFLKIDLENFDYSITESEISVASYDNVYKKNDNEFYFIQYINSADHIYIFNVNNMNKVEHFIISKSHNGRYITYADDNYISLSGSDSYGGYLIDVKNKDLKFSVPGYTYYSYILDNYMIYTPSCKYNSNDYNVLRIIDLNSGKLLYTSNVINYKIRHCSFFVNNSIYLIPYKATGYIEKFTINDFQLEGENLVFTDVNNPLSYQDILSNYIASDKYGRALMTSVKADSYYNSFSTPGNYDATITVSDGYCHEDFAITIVVNKGGGEEEKKESSGSTIKWDTNLMIQSFGGIAVFLVIGLLVVSIIKKILR